MSTNNIPRNLKRIHATSEVLFETGICGQNSTRVQPDGEEKTQRGHYRIPVGTNGFHEQPHHLVNHPLLGLETKTCSLELPRTLPHSTLAVAPWRTLNHLVLAMALWRTLDRPMLVASLWRTLILHHRPSLFAFLFSGLVATSVHPTSLFSRLFSRWVGPVGLVV